jgi:hypothetical protein
MAGAYKNLSCTKAHHVLTSSQNSACPSANCICLETLHVGRDGPRPVRENQGLNWVCLFIHITCLFVHLFIRSYSIAAALYAQPCPVHSHALAASALHTPLNCHPTPTPISLSASLSSIALALPSITSRCLPTKTARLVSYKH